MWSSGQFLRFDLTTSHGRHMKTIAAHRVCLIVVERILGIPVSNRWQSIDHIQGYCFSILATIHICRHSFQGSYCSETHFDHINWHESYTFNHSTISVNLVNTIIIVHGLLVCWRLYGNYRTFTRHLHAKPWNLHLHSVLGWSLILGLHTLQF